MILVVLIIFAVIIYKFPMLFCVVKNPIKTVKYIIKDVYIYFKHRKYNNAPFGQLNGYVADGTAFGSGKTLTSTLTLVMLYKHYNGKFVWCDKRNRLVKQRIHIMSNIDFKTIPYEHMESLSQFVQHTDVVNQYDLDNDTLTVTYVLIDESSSQMNSRNYKNNFDMEFISRLLTSRHVRSSLLYTSQTFQLTDALMRQVTNTVIGCRLVWRYQIINYYNARDVENCANTSMLKPLSRKCVFITDNEFKNYDTYAMLETLKTSCKQGDRLSEKEILDLQCNQNLDISQAKIKKKYKKKR